MSRATILLAGLVFLTVAFTGGGFAAADGVAVAQQNNTTIQHENPDDVDADGNTDDVRRWLQSRLGGLLGNSTLQLSQGQYEAASRLLGEQYDEYFEKYVDVAGETEGQDDDTAATALNETRTEQRQYASTLSEYRETYRAYQAAKEAGNETRAQRLARKLVRLAERLAGTSRKLTESYDRIGNLTGVNVSETVETIRSITGNVTAQRQSVVAAEFVETTLRVRDVSATGSYARPVRIRGVLTAENESSALPETVTLRVQGESRTVALSETGAFTVTYRPVLERVGERALSVAYVPDETALFLGARANASTRIEPVTPILTVGTAATDVGYGEAVRVNGTVTVNGLGVAGVPISVSFAGERVVVRSGDDGGFAATVTVPAGVDPGAVNVTAAVSVTGRAIARTNASTVVSVVETASALSADARVRDEATVVTGRLTAASRGVPGQRVAILRNGTRIATATTGPNGTFSTPIARSIAERGVTLRVVFSGTETNLEASSATVAVPAAPGSDAGAGGGLSIVSVGIGLAVLAGGGGAVVWYRRRTREGGPEPDAGSESVTGADDGSATESPGEIAEAEVSGVPMAVTSAGDVRGAYARMRRAVGPALERDEPGRTHWEFAEAVRTELEEPIGDAVETLAGVYERAAYAEVALTDAEVADARAALATIDSWLAERQEREAFSTESRSGDVNG